MSVDFFSELPLADKLQCDELCRAFERNWQSGEPASIEDILANTEPRLQAPVCCELLQLECEFRGDMLSPKRCQQYAERFPAVANLISKMCKAPPAPETVRLDRTEIRDADLPIADMKVGEYQIEQRLASGAMGVVYVARHQRLGRQVALKLVLTGPHASREELARFQLEAKAAAGLQHPGIVQIYEVGVHDQRPFLAMEFVSGLTLSQHIAGQAQPPREAAEIIERLARAISFAHRQGVIHRDLKPGNILLADISSNSEGSSSLSGLQFEPKITDFGLAKQDESSYDLTRTGHVLGTPAYMAPEQASGQAHHAGPTADIYSLGAILYELLTGQPPFRAATVVETLRQVQQEMPMPPHRWQRHLSRDLETICLKCLEKDPAHRYTNADELADDLGRYLRREPVHVRPVGMLGRSARWARRKPLLATLVVLVAAVVLIGGPVITGLYLKAGAESSRARQQEQMAIKNLVHLRSVSSIHAMQDGEYAAALTMLESAINERRKLPEEVADLISHDHLQIRYDAVKYRTPRHVRTFSLPKEFSHLSTFAPVFADNDGTLQFVDKFGQELWQASLNSDERSEVVAVQPPAGQSIVYDSNAQWQLFIGGDPPLQLKKADGSTEPLSLQVPGDDFLTQFGSMRVLPEKQMVVICQDIHCCCWDLRTGRLLKMLNIENGAPKGWICRQHHLLSFTQPNMFSLVQLPDFQMPLENISYGGAPVVNHQCSGIAINPAGELLVLAKEGGGVRIFDLRENPPAELPSLATQLARVTAMRFDPSGQWLALGEENGALHCWDVLGRRVLPLDWRHGGNVTALRFSPDGLWLASGGDDGVVRLINAATGRATSSQLAHSSAVLHAVFSSRGDRIAVLTENKSLHLWNLRDSTPDRILTHSAPVTSVAFDASGQRLATGDQLGVVHTWDVSSSSAGDSLECQRGAKKLQWSGNRLGVVGHIPGRPHGFSLRDLTQNKWVLDDIGTKLGNHVGPHEVRIGPDGSWLAVAFADRLNLLDLDSEHDAAQFLTGHPHLHIAHVVFSPNGRYLVLSAWVTDENSAKIAVIEVPEGREVYRLSTPPNSKIGWLQFTPDSRRLIAVGRFGVRMWQMADGSQCDVGATVRKMRWANGALSRDGRYLATIDGRHQAQIWDMENWRPLGQKISLGGAPVFAGFDPSGRRFATATAKGVARLWDWETGEPLTPPLLHGAPINDAAFSPDGRWLAVAGNDRAARLWRLSLDRTADDGRPKQDWRPGWHLLQADEAQRFNHAAAEIFHLGHLLQLRPDDQQSALRLAAVCLQAGQGQQTIDILTPLLHGQVASGELYLACARARLQLNQTDAALEDLQQAAAVAPELPELPLWRAVTHVLQGDSAAADRDCQDMAEWTLDRWLLSPDRLPRHVEQQSLAAKQRRWQPLRTIATAPLLAAEGDAKRSWLQIRALANLASGEQEAAQQDWQAIVQQWPDDPMARYALALYAAKYELWDQVLAHAVETDTGDGPWQFLQAIALDRQQQPAAALPRVNSALEQGACNAATYALRARLLLVLGDLPAAMHDVRNAFAEDAENADAWDVCGHVHAQQGAWDLAAEAFAKVENATNALQPWQDYMWSCLMAGQVDQAATSAKSRMKFIDKIDHVAWDQLVLDMIGPSAACPQQAGVEFTPTTIDYLTYQFSEQGSGQYAASLALLLCRCQQFDQADDVMQVRRMQGELNLREQAVAALIRCFLDQDSALVQQVEAIRHQMQEAKSMSWQQRAEIEILLRQVATPPSIMAEGRSS